jgi:hypothetical protein
MAAAGGGESACALAVRLQDKHPTAAIDPTTLRIAFMSELVFTS